MPYHHDHPDAYSQSETLRTGVKKLPLPDVGKVLRLTLSGIALFTLCMTIAIVLCVAAIPALWEHGSSEALRWCALAGIAVLAFGGLALFMLHDSYKQVESHIEWVKQQRGGKPIPVCHNPAFLIPAIIATILTVVLAVLLVIKFYF